MTDTIEYKRLCGIKIVPNWAIPEGVMYIHPATFGTLLSEKNFSDQIENKTCKINITD